MTFNPDYSGLLAVGSYSGLVGIYVEGERGVVSVLEGHRGGVTQVRRGAPAALIRAVTDPSRQALFTPDGNYLFTGARKENDILCWDIRNTSRVVMRLSRLVDTNQHIHFDIDPTGRYLITASQVRPLPPA
jgi:WD40 repeat protein